MPSLLRIPWLSWGWSPACFCVEISPFYIDTCHTAFGFIVTTSSWFDHLQRLCFQERGPSQVLLLLFSYSVVSDSLWPPWTAGCQASLSFTIFQSLFKLMSIEPVMPSNYFTFCHPLVLLLSVFSSIRVFSSESTLHIKWLKYWSFSFLVLRLAGIEQLLSKRFLSY